MVEDLDAAILGSAIFPEFSASSGTSVCAVAVNSVGTVRGYKEELLRQAYRKGYAEGYSRSRMVQRQRATSVLQVLRRLCSDIRDKSEYARHDVETRVDDIAKVVAADLVAEQVAASVADR